MKLLSITPKTIVFSSVLAFLTLTVTNLHAQSDDNGGLFGWGKVAEKEMFYRRGLMNKGGDPESFLGYNLYNQQFGDNQDGGYNLYNQTFGQEVPMGSGLLLFAVAGAGYALGKRKNNGNKKS